MSLSQEAMPMVELTLRGMRYSISQALGNHLVEVQEAAEAAVAHALESFDFTAEAERAIEATLRAELQRAIRVAADELFRTPAVAEAIQGAVKQAIVAGRMPAGGK